MTRGEELSQLQKFQANMDMLTKTTFEVVNQFEAITKDLDSIADYVERQKNRKEEINVMVDLLDEKLESLAGPPPDQALEHLQSHLSDNY